jgi:hypothetical protein
MIKLNIEDYCQTCAYFEADVEKCSYTDTHGVVHVTMTDVHCIHRDVCANLKNHLALHMNDDHCVICGDIIPEGCLVCPECEKRR